MTIPDPDALWNRIDRLERRVDFLIGLMPPIAAFAAAWVTYQILTRALAQGANEAYALGLFVFAGLWFWLFLKLGKMR